MQRKASKSSSGAASSRAGKISVIIETPRGSRNKLKYEPSKRMDKLSKVMPEGMVFPYDFGFVPETKAEDGDPLDVLVLTDEPLFTGCLVDCEPIGVLELEQKEEGEVNRNDRLIAVAEQSLLYSNIKDLARLNPIVVKQIEAFFVNYQKVRDIKVRILGRHGPDKARELLHRARRRKR